MGLIADFKAIKDVQKISNGGNAKLSMSQIVNIIINLPEANKNLSNDEYKQIFDLYNKFRSCNTKIDMDKEKYYATCTDIIREFDKIAPYEKYSGLNPFEASFIMKGIRTEEEINSANEEMWHNKNDDSIIGEKDYITILVNESKGTITEKEAEEFVKIIRLYNTHGKDETITAFKEWAQKYREEKGPEKALMPISYLIGALNANDIISDDEVKKLSDENAKIITEEIMKKYNK